MVTSALTHVAATVVAVTTSLGHLHPVQPAYGWPVKPFDRQHPVRAFLNDPRIGSLGGKAFHFGIDIAAPDGTPVYAVAGGKLYLSHGSLCVVADPGHEFGYWHIRAAAGLKEHQLVRTHQLLGTIAPGWGHVHFAERIGDAYVNPLRPGGIGPYTDPVPPTITAVKMRRNAIIVYAHDTTWPPVPGPWANEPVTPALLRWRLGDGAWHVAADFRRQMLDRALFDSIYAPDTTQNHEGVPGNFAFYLTHRLLRGRLEVEASDTRGNRVDAIVELTPTAG